MKRFVSAFVIGGAFVCAILWSKVLFMALMVALAVGMGYEWWHLAGTWGVFLCGCVLLGVCLGCLASLRLESVEVLLWYFVCVWSMDTFAMIGGRAIGGAKFAPSISPKKTWSGVVVGCCASAVITSAIYEAPVWAMIIGFVSQLSDIMVSYFKRKKGIKDSNTRWTTIPGHGGFLDRFDSILLSSLILRAFHGVIFDGFMGLASGSHLG